VIVSPAERQAENKLAVTDEKDLSTAQSPSQTHARLPRPDGLAGGAQDPQTPARARASAIDGLDSSETARLEREAAPHVRSEWSFGPADRLHRRAEYLQLQKIGARCQTAHFVMYAGTLAEADCASARSRLGMTVSGRIGSAVVRNRTRRRIRECYRLKLRSMFPEGTALIVIARAGAGALKTPAIIDELLHAASNLAARIARPQR
jgi:ribonuclease P protein component